MVGGGFNVVRFMEERRGSTRSSRSMRRFYNFKQDMALIDLPLHEGILTWERGQNNPRVSMINRFLVSVE